MKITPKDHAESYKKQEQMGTYAVPPSGTYIVVNTKVSKQIVGVNQTVRYRYRATILQHVESENNEGASFVGKSLSFDLWGNFEKTFNVERMSHLGIACGQVEAWDPDDSSGLTKATTGVPYQLKMVRKDREYNGQVRQDCEPSEFKGIGADAKAKWTKSPDWAKTAGNPAERFVDESKNPPKHKIGGKAPVKDAGQNDPFKDDDIPF